MSQLNKIHEYEFLYGNRIATAFVLDHGVKIIGFIHGNTFDLRVLTVGFNPKRNGLGQKALEFIRPKFKKISVNEIYEEALPFWVKMKERGLVDSLESVKEGTDIYLLDQIAGANAPVGRLTIVNSIGIVSVNHIKQKVEIREICESGANSLYNAHSPPDPELEYVCGI